MNVDQRPDPPSPVVRIKVIGVGTAGSNAVEHMARTGLDGVQFAVVNTHALALDQCAVPEKLLLASRLRRGLGTGGDPDQGRTAAEADLEALRALCREADIVFVLAGMGGGTGTGVSPVIARLARESGALVLAVVTLPFEWEGSRRLRQALFGVQVMKAAADGVICLPNQKLSCLIGENASILETFQRINAFIATGVSSVWRMLTQPGLIRIDLADLCAVAQGRHAENLLLTAEATGPDRAQELIKQLFAHPLLEKDEGLAEADTLVVSLVGGPDLTMMEVRYVLEQLHQRCGQVHLIMGATVDETMRDSIGLTVLAGQPATGPREGSRLGMNPGGEHPHHAGGESPHPHAIETPFLRESRSPRPPSRFVPPPPALTPEERQEYLARNGGVPAAMRRQAKLEQGMLPLEVVSKGRFENSEPTIYRGEDLDIPTYIRRGVALN